MIRFAPLALLLAACSTPPTLHGQVTDIWGQPLSGITVQLAEAEPALTDASGAFAFMVEPGELMVRAGADGYIQAATEVVYNLGAEVPKASLALYPQPDAGFFLVGAEEYHQIEPQVVRGLGNQLGAFHGVQTLGEALLETEHLESRDFEVVFHTTLRLDEIHRLDLELHRLDFVHEATSRGITGEVEVPINLYTSSGKVPIEITPMASRNDYLITARETLEPGPYAFHTQRLLTPRDEQQFARVPEQMRAAFPFEVR